MARPIPRFAPVTTATGRALPLACVDTALPSVRPRRCDRCPDPGTYTRRVPWGTAQRSAVFSGEILNGSGRVRAPARGRRGTPMRGVTTYAEASVMVVLAYDTGFVAADA